MHRFAEHTGEVELELAAPTQEAVFAEALDAFRELLGESGEGPSTRREVALVAPDPPLLLVEWLSELVFLAETEGFVPERAARLELACGRLRATVEGRIGRPPHLVKAVTLNRLELEEARDGWHARLVLDV